MPTTIFDAQILEILENQDTQGFQTQALTLLGNQVSETQNLLSFFQSQETEEDTFQADSLASLQASQASLATLVTTTGDSLTTLGTSQSTLSSIDSNQGDLLNLATTRNELLEFAKAQTAKRTARLTIRRLTDAQTFTIPEAIVVNLLVANGTANLAIVNYNESDSSIITLPTGFNLNLPYRDQFYCYSSMDIELFAGSVVYATYEEPFSTLYPDLSGSGY